MWVIIVVWVLALVIGGALGVRFTKAPSAPTLRVPGQNVKVRRVLPLWLVLVELILLVVAIWVTFHVGNP
jgi:hypothetical protein